MKTKKYLCSSFKLTILPKIKTDQKVNRGYGRSNQLVKNWISALGVEWHMVRLVFDHIFEFYQKLKPTEKWTAVMVELTGRFKLKWGSGVESQPPRGWFSSAWWLFVITVCMLKICIQSICAVISLHALISIHAVISIRAVKFQAITLHKNGQFDLTSRLYE